MVTEGTNPGQPWGQNNSVVAQMGDVPPKAGEGKGRTPRLDQLEVSQAQPRSITWGLGSEHTLLFTLQEQRKVSLGPLFLLFLLTKVYLHPELPRCLWLGWGEMALEPQKTRHCQCPTGFGTGLVFGRGVTPALCSWELIGQREDFAPWLCWHGCDARTRLGTRRNVCFKASF